MNFISNAISHLHYQDISLIPQNYGLAQDFAEIIQMYTQIIELKIGLFFS